MDSSEAGQQSQAETPVDVGGNRAVDQNDEVAQANESSDRQAEAHDCDISGADSDDGLFVDQEDEIKSEDGSQDESQDETDDEGDDGGDDSEDGGENDRHSRAQSQQQQLNIEDARDNGENDQQRDLELHHELGADNEDNEDDECVEIDANEVSDAARARFAEFTFGARPEAAGDVICMGSALIKVEEQQDDGFRTSPERSDDGADPDFQMDEDDILSDGERPKKRRRPVPRRPAKQKKPAAPEAANYTNLGSQLEKGGNAGQKVEEPTDEELNRMFTQHEELIALKAKGPLSFTQRLTLARVSAQIASIERRASLQDSDPMQSLDNGQDEDEAADEAVNQVLASSASGLLPAQARGTTPLTLATGEGAAPNEERATGTGAKKRPPSAKTAKEFWEREYAEKGSGVRNMTDGENTRKRKRPLGLKKTNRRKAGRGSNPRESKLMRMLQDANPVMARAAQGAMAMPGAIQTTNRTDQLKAMKDFLFKINGNQNPRSRPVDMRILKHAVKSFGIRQVRTVNDKWKLRGMTSTLYNHQLVGVSRMLCQEFSPDGPYGGILADQMGLGKTVQMLAAMSANRPTAEQRAAGRHQTLIVAPAVAIGQWMREIVRHCDKSFIKSVHHYKARADVTREVWQTADIVIASYNEITNAYPSEKALQRIAGRKLDEEEWAEEFEAELGDLFKTEFFRVVLDEGHAIRNYHTKTSKACINLTSKYRWILSGTPVHNSIDEFYPYFRFLGAHWATDADEFAKQFGNIDKDDSRERLDAVVASIMIRRHVHDRFLGAPILQIPQTHPPEIIWVDLTTEERLIYRRLESRFRDNMSTHIKAGIAPKKLKTYLAYLTRLRQAVAHPFLLEGVLQENFTLEDFDFLRQKLAKEGGKKAMHGQLQHWVKMEYEASIGGAGEHMGFGKSRFGYEFDMNAQLEEMEAGKSLEDVICRICYDTPVEPRITVCGHTFCQECISGSMQLEVNPSCPTCKAPISSVTALRVPEGRPGAQSNEENDGRQPRGKKKKKEAREVGDDENWAQPKLRDSSKWVKQYDDNYPNKDLTASAKTIAVKNQILIWQREAFDDKIIVFVNWAKLACIIGRMLFEEGIQFLYYFGDLGKEVKDAAIQDFQDNPDIKVMIASIRCGGQALNLNFANRVISVDQWWNTAMENQAFGRVHRIGQEKETYFVKIIVKDSIDERLLEMQQGKEQMISKALQEDAKHKTAPTLEELVRLFGADGGDGGGGGGGGGEGTAEGGAVSGEGVGEGEREVIVLDDEKEGERVSGEEGEVIVLDDEQEGEGEGNKAGGDEAMEVGIGEEVEGM